MVPVTSAGAHILDGADLVVAGGPTRTHGMSRPGTRKMAGKRARKPGSEVELVPGAVSGPGAREWLASPGRLEVAGAAFGTRLQGLHPPTVNLRPSADWPDWAVVAVDLARVRAVIERIAADVDELARARRVQDKTTAAVLPDRRAERRRRLAEPDLEFRAFCARKGLPASSILQLERAWDAWQAERYRRGEIGQRPGYTDNPFRPR